MNLIILVSMLIILILVFYTKENEYFLIVQDIRNLKPRQDEMLYDTHVVHLLSAIERLRLSPLFNYKYKPEYYALLTSLYIPRITCKVLIKYYPHYGNAYEESFGCNGYINENKVIPVYILFDALDKKLIYY